MAAASVKMPGSLATARGKSKLRGVTREVVVQLVQFVEVVAFQFHASLCVLVVSAFASE